MFKLNRTGNFAYYTSSLLEETGLVKHGFTTREGGVSTGCFRSMNLRFHGGDSRENVLQNFKIAAQALGMEYDRLVLSKQVHEDNIITVDESFSGNGIAKENRFSSADGLMTDRSGVPLVTLFADCMPLLFLDVKNRVIASVHSGWKGTVQRIPQKAIRKMKNDFGSSPEDIIAVIGPSIQEDHFEVGDDVAEIFIREFSADTVTKHKDKYHVNMQKAAELQILDEGVTRTDNCGICTFCESEFLFSHRKTNGMRGNMGAFIELCP